MNIFELLKKADVLKVDDFLLSHWHCEFDVDDDDTALEFNYTDAEGLIYQFEFTKESLNQANFRDGNAFIVDTNNDIVEITFFTLTKLVGNS